MNTYHLSKSHFWGVVLDPSVDYVRFKADNLIEITYKDQSIACVSFYEYDDRWAGDQRLADQG